MNERLFVQTDAIGRITATVTLYTENMAAPVHPFQSEVMGILKREIEEKFHRESRGGTFDHRTKNFIPVDL